MIIDFEKDSAKVIDSVSKKLSNFCDNSFTIGQLRTFVVDTVISSLSYEQILKIVENRICTNI